MSYSATTDGTYTACWAPIPAGSRVYAIGSLDICPDCRDEAIEEWAE